MNYLDPDYNPLLETAETDYRKRIDQYVRDLAWGILNRKWDSQLNHLSNIHKYGPRVDPNSVAGSQFVEKWSQDMRPFDTDLWIWEYVSKDYGVLTPKAFDLLHTPSSAPNVFISYRHKACNSSTLALAIEARLKLLGNNNTFIDKTINAGDSIQERIDKSLDNCDVFVILIDREIFESKWTIYEYEKAISLSKKVIAIKHPDVTQEDLNKIVARGFDMGKLFITCYSSGAIDYEKAINELLNVLGYSTY